MKSLRIFLLLTLTLIACTPAAVLTQSEVDSWLLTISGNEPPAINVAGEWYDAKGNPVFGWGEGYLRQEHNKITGAIGDYLINGRVSGDKVYLVFLSGGTVYYTARLEMFEDGILTGSYYKADDKEQMNGYPTSFKREGPAADSERLSVYHLTGR